MGRNLKIGLICLFGLILSAYLYLYLLLPQIVPWDESNHLYWGWRFYNNLGNGDFRGLWETIWTQWNYPPVQSVITGVFSFLTGGFSIEKARSLSVVWFWGSVVLIWKIGGLVAQRREDPRIRERFLSDVRNDKGNRLPRLLKLLKLTQALPVFLFVTSPLVLFYSTNHMKEGLGVFLTLLTVYFYFMAREDSSLRQPADRTIRSNHYLLLSGIALLLTTFEKYNYGILIGMAIGLEEVLEIIIRFSKSPRELKVFRLLKEIIVNNFLIFGPTMVAFFFWAVWPKNQIELLYKFLHNDWIIYSLNDTSALVHIFFFPLEFLSSYSFSYIVGVLGLIGVFGIFGRLWDFRVRVLFLFFLLNLIIGTRQFINQQARYFITSIPALFLLTGVGMQKFLISNSQFLNNFKLLISKTFRRRPILIGVLGGVGAVGGIVLLIELMRLPFMVRPTAAHVNLAAVYGERDYRDNQFNFNKFSWPRAYQGNIYEKQIEVVRYIVERVDLTKPVYIFGRTNEFSPPFFDLLFGMERKRLGDLGELGGLGREYNEYFVVLEVQPGGILDTGDYKKMNKNFSNSEIARFRAAVNTQMLSSRTYNEFGLTVEIWGR